METFTFSTESGDVLIVDKGFVCDLASVHRWFKSVVDTPSYWTQAAVLHDKLYANNRQGLYQGLTRKDADRILIEGMRAKEKEYSIPWHIRRKTLVYRAVRLGGAASWAPTGE